MWWIVGVVAVVCVVATYLTWIASRVDRLHARTTSASVALDAALVRRAVAASDLADAEHLLELRTVASSALAAEVGEREAAENSLTKMLRELPYALDAPAMVEVASTSRRVELNRHIHSDLVRDTLAMRRRRLVRVLRFTRKYPVPSYFDIEDPQLTAPS
ncbi:MAG TPA: hypothetical protein VGJ28_02950 [Micromonosporaceae bacterium]|jgi:hypothetical protein